PRSKASRHRFTISRAAVASRTVVRTWTTVAAASTLQPCPTDRRTRPRAGGSSHRRRAADPRRGSHEAFPRHPRAARRAYHGAGEGRRRDQLHHRTPGDARAGWRVRLRQDDDIAPAAPARATDRG